MSANVPTQAEFNALAARVAALEASSLTAATALNALAARVAALEAIRPPTPTPTPTPTPVDSADLTTIPPATVIIAGGIPYTLVGGRVYVNGTLVVTAYTVALLKRVAHPVNPVPAGVYLKTTVGTWYGPVTALSGGVVLAGDPCLPFPVAPSPAPSPTPSPKVPGPVVGMRVA